MRSSHALVLGLLLSFAPLHAATAQPEPEGETTLTLAKLVAVKNLRCDALGRAKNARLRADVHRAELSTVAGANKINTENQVRQAEADSGAAFEEAGSLKKRLTSMLDRYVSAHRLLWYQTVDEAERVRLEDLIGGAREVVQDDC